jgi:mannose-6-phosphate isomerase-like protein (cupin superfamily)
MTTQQNTLYSIATLAAEHAPKEFLKEQLQLTGMEISWTEVPVGKASPVVHSHKENEELYINVQGDGQVFVDGEFLDFPEGTFIRIAPAGKRAVRNTGTKPLQYLCIQARENSLTQWTREDGILHQDEVAWPAL